MSLLDIRVPAVLLRIDRNPFHHGTLGAVRSLGRAGVDVHVVADSVGSPVRKSRFVSRLHPPPPPGASLTEIAMTLRQVAARIARPAVLIAMDDAGAVAVGRLREELEPAYLLPRQPGALAERVADKAELAAVCAAVDVPHPVTVIPESAAQAAGAAWQLGLPVVAKWSRPWLLPAGSGLRSTVVVRSTQEARELFQRTEEAGSRLLLQEFLPPGPDLDWFFHGYADHSGAVRGGGPGRKLCSWPRGAGLTAVGRWTPNPQVQTLAERLTGALGYRGILDLDFRRCGTTGRYHLLDFNPRPGAQFRLFSDTAGLDVVRAQHLDLTHRSLPDGAPQPEREFVVENYAPLAALGRSSPARRELAWYAPDDPGPGRAMWGLWCRHVSRRLVGRLRGLYAVRDTEVRPRVVRQASAPTLPSATTETTGVPAVTAVPSVTAVTAMPSVTAVTAMPSVTAVPSVTGASAVTDVTEPTDDERASSR